MKQYAAVFDMMGTCVPNPPYAGKEVHAIRGIPLPKDYFEFMKLHNGGIFTDADHDANSRMILFTIEQIQNGDCYKDEHGCWIGSAYSLACEHQNTDTQTITTCHGVDPGDAVCLYQAFYDQHIVIGYNEWMDADQARYDLLAIDRDGYYRVIADGDVEELGRHEFGNAVGLAHGSYVKYNACIYETPAGLIAPVGNTYEIIDKQELEQRKKRYGYYRTVSIAPEARWKYTFWHADQGDWQGYSIMELFEFFLSGEM